MEDKNEDKNEEKNTERSLPSASEVFGGLGWIIKPLIVLGVIVMLVGVGLDIMPYLQREICDGLRLGLNGIFSGSRDERLVKTVVFIIVAGICIKALMRRM
jgi:hypothetical protein